MKILLSAPVEFSSVVGPRIAYFFLAMKTSVLGTWSNLHETSAQERHPLLTLKYIFPPTLLMWPLL